LIAGGESEPIPEEIDWWVHRVATSGRYHSSLKEIQNEWTLHDLLDAIIVLDIYDKLEDRASRSRDE
jgi:hypothetical protein